MPLRIIDTRTADGRAELEALRQVLHSVAGYNYLKENREQWHKDVQRIIQNIADNGDKAVIECTKEYDRLELTADTLRVSSEELQAAAREADLRFMEAVRRAIDNVRSYQERIKPKGLQWNQDGIELGIRFEPIQRVGVYAPGGKAVYPSSVIMTVVPAQVAGVKEIAVCC